MSLSILMRGGVLHRRSPVQATSGQKPTLSERAYAMSQFVSNRHQRAHSTPLVNSSDATAADETASSIIGKSSYNYQVFGFADSPYYSTVSTALTSQYCTW